MKKLLLALAFMLSTTLVAKPLTKEQAENMTLEELKADLDKEFKELNKLPPEVTLMTCMMFGQLEAALKQKCTVQPEPICEKLIPFMKYAVNKCTVKIEEIRPLLKRSEPSTYTPQKWEDTTK